MINPKPLLSTLIFISIATVVLGQDIEVPTFDDKYSKFVKQLEEGSLDIDYTDFRDSFLDSKQFRKKGSRYDSLKRQTYEAIQNKNYQEIIQLTKAMLGIDYTSMFAHKYLQQTYKALGDTINQRKYHDIEFGLLNSIVRSGDGETCETGWHVVQIEEEYFILRMIGAQPENQSISKGGNNACDMMVAKADNGEEKVFYFEANKVFEQERKLFGQ